MSEPIGALTEVLGPGHRNDVFELRAAPVQCSYLGYPGTMGAGYMDYFLSDRVATPPELAHAFTEKCTPAPPSFPSS